MSGGPIWRTRDARGVSLAVRITGGTVIVMQGHGENVPGLDTSDVIGLDDAATVRELAHALLDAADAMPGPVAVAGAPLLLPTGTTR